MTGRSLVLVSALALVLSTSRLAVADPPAPPTSTAQLDERVRQTIVSIERDGVPVAMGLVLSSKTGFLTVLSALGDGSALEVRYADGSLAPARIVRRDATLDVALLATSSAPHTEVARPPLPAPPPVAPSLWLGVRGEPQVGGGMRGVRVVAVAPQSPAASADVRASDVIVAIDGQALAAPEDLAGALTRRKVGDTVRLLVYRQGDFHDLSVALREVPKT